MTQHGIERELELRRRLLSHITANVTEDVIEIATDGLREFLSEVPEYAGELLAPLFELSDYWPNAMAKVALGLPANDDLDIEELLDRFENPTKEGENKNIEWVKDGF